VPLKLKELGAGDITNAVLNKALAYTVVFLLAPIVSFRSDRTRTCWGRRIPYLLWSTPFVGLFLVLIGYYDSLTNLVTGGAAQVTLMGITITKATATLMVIGTLMIGWDFRDILVQQREAEIAPQEPDEDQAGVAEGADLKLRLGFGEPAAEPGGPRRFGLAAFVLRRGGEGRGGGLDRLDRLFGSGHPSPRDLRRRIPRRRILRNFRRILTRPDYSIA
jgi:hypothetical protein